MELRCINFMAIWIAILGVSWALPSAMVEEIKNSELKNSKVKRAESNSAPTAEENPTGNSYNNIKPAASKRGKVFLPQILPPPSYQDLYNLQSGLYSSDYPLVDEKTLQNYDRDLQQYGPYSSARSQLDDALETAILKGELYGDPIGQYRYYGPDDKRRKREALKLRIKREAIRPDIELTPEDVLALLELYENSAKNKDSDNYRQPWTRYGSAFEQPETQEFDLPDDTWLDGPVYPHANLNNIDSNYLHDFEVPPQYEARGKWSRFADAVPSNKRFLAKRRSQDPTHMLRYLNGPNENDFDTLSRIFNNQKEQKTNTPVYRPLYL